MTLRTCVAIAALGLAVAGCGGNQSGAAAGSSAGSPPVAPLTSAPAAPGTLRPFADTCGASPLGSAPVVMRSVAGPGGERLAVAEVAPAAHASGTTVLLLHQDKPEAMCGWRDYAQHLAARGHRVLLMDECGYGQSTCDTAWGTQYAEQVVTVATWARQKTLQRLVLVGASMGGGHAVQAAPGARADAVVDLSGPPAYMGADITVDAPKVTVPLLVVMSTDDPEGQLATVAAAVKASPARVKQVRATAGSHGWGMVVHEGAKGPELAAVTDWVEGRYPRR